MYQILFCVLITALLCNGVYIATSENMLLYFIRERLDKLFYVTSVPVEDEDAPGTLKQQKIYRKIYWPILHCVKCMPSIYGTLVTLFFLPFTLELTWQIPLIVVCSVPVSAIIYHLYD